jgi:hypothetical protein
MMKVIWGAEMRLIFAEDDWTDRIVLKRKGNFVPKDSDEIARSFSTPAPSTRNDPGAKTRDEIHVPEPSSKPQRHSRDIILNIEITSLIGPIIPCGISELAGSAALCYR